MKKKSKPSRPKKDEPKQFRIAWTLAAPFLMKNWTLLEVETDKKGKMTAVLLAKS